MHYFHGFIFYATLSLLDGIEAVFKLSLSFVLRVRFFSELDYFCTG
jgi:hypothetical protein